MREIKFRAWDLNERKMIVEGDGYCQNVYCYAQDNACTLMQYTGLKDKNGKEIYEGDIVNLKIGNSNNMYVKIIWWSKYNMFAFKHLNQESTMFKARAFCRPSLRLYATKGIEPIYQNIRFFEVVGNIYENKELLNGN